MRGAALSVAISAILLLSALHFLPGANADADDPVRVELRVTFTDARSGHLHFFMGSGEEMDLNHTEGLPPSIRPYVNDNMDRLLRALKLGGVGALSMVRSVLDTPGTLNITGTEMRSRAERGYFGFSLDTEFHYSGEGMAPEYDYLDFIYEIDEMFRVGSAGLDGISSAIAKERELRRIRIHLDVELDNGLSATTSKTVSDHRRSVSRETISDDTNGQEFLRSSNGLKVFDHALLSPAFTFILLLAILILGYGLLAFVWWRERFKGVALILPIATAVFPILPVLLFFFPGLSLYSLAGGTVWLLGGLFLLFVGACNLFNPKRAYKDFEEEREEQPSLKLPEVIYINKRVFVDRPVRISDEEAMDPYEVLDVRRKASWEEIDKAYKSKIKEYHPDKFVRSPSRIHKAAREETERLNTAYERLKRKHGM
ncbi:MAG: J domain-containing protein [Thermoplasmatota archaeon]